MKTKKIISILLTVLLIFSFCSFFVSAADGTGDFDIDDCTVIASKYPSTGGYTNVTKELTVTDVTSGIYKGLRWYSFPSFSEGEDRSSIMIKVIEGLSLRVEHEYNLKFRWAYNYGVPYNFIVTLRFLDASGATIKSQVLYSTSTLVNSKSHL